MQYSAKHQDKTIITFTILTKENFNYFDIVLKVWHLHYLVRSVDLIMTLIIAFELQKENIESHEVTRSEEGYVF